jgi:hypothetical protein
MNRANLLRMEKLNVKDNGKLLRGVALAVLLIGFHANVFCQKLGNTCGFAGLEPKAPPCYDGMKCTPDGWVAGPLLKNGSACQLPGGTTGQCKGPVCEPLPPTQTGTFSPDYILVTIIYAPPGNKSRASYFQGSSAGTNNNVSNAFGQGIKAGVTGDIIAEGSYTVTNQTSSSFQVTKTLTSELDNFGTADTITHGQDMVYLWLNPEINYSQQQSPGSPVNISLGTVGGAQMNVIELTGDEVTQKVPIPSWKLTNATLTTYDLQQLASVDPWLGSANYNPASNPNRFVLETELQLDGPDAAGGDPPGQGVSANDAQQTCTANTTSQQVGADLGTSVGFDFFGASEKVTAVKSWTMTTTNSYGNCNGSSQTAFVDLVTTTVSFHDVIDVYFDSIVQSFAYVSATGGIGYPADGANVTGTLRNAAGQVLANQAMVATFANGRSRTLFSNAQGIYRIFAVPAGAVKIQSGDITSQVIVKPGPAVKHDLVIPNRILPTPILLPTKP